LALALGAAGTSAATAAEPENRVGFFDVAAPTAVGDGAAEKPSTHGGTTTASRGLASGYLVAAKEGMGLSARTADNEALQNTLARLYKPDEKYGGGTAGALREEARTGQGARGKPPGICGAKRQRTGEIPRGPAGAAVYP